MGPEVDVMAEDAAHPPAHRARRLDAAGHGPGPDRFDMDRRTLGHPPEVRRDAATAQGLDPQAGHQLGLRADG